MDYRKKQKMSLKRLYLSHKTHKTETFHIGLSNKIQRDRYIIFIDCDDRTRLSQLIGGLDFIARKFELSPFYIIQSSLWKYQAISFTIVNWNTLTQIMNLALLLGIVEPEYIWCSKKKHYMVLRVGQKNGQPPKLLYKLEGCAPENNFMKNLYENFINHYTKDEQKVNLHNGLQINQ